MPIRKKPNGGWAIVFKYIARYRRDVLVYSALGVISAMANGTIPLIFGMFFDAILNSEQFVYGGWRLPMWAVILSLGGVVQIIADVVDWNNDVRSRRIGTYFSSSYIAEAVAKLVRMPVTLHKENKAGVIWDKVFRSRNYLVQIIERVVLNLAPQILSVLVGFVVAFYINPALAGVILLGVVIYVATLAKIVPPIVKLQKQGEKRWNRAHGYAYDALANLQPVKQSGAEQHESRKVWHQYVNRVAKVWFGVEKIWGGIAFYQRLLVTATRISVFVLSVMFIQQGDLTIGGLIALNGYAAMVFGPFVRLGYDWQTIQNGLVAIERGESLLNTPQEEYRPEGGLGLKDVRGEIEFKNVSFAYKKGEPRVLDNISFRINPGEVVALIGESGVGKSTLIDLISRYYVPDRGTVSVDGHDIGKVYLDDLRKRIAVVPQEVVLFNDTVKNNIKYGNFSATDAQIKKAAQEASADVFIGKLPKRYKSIVGERGVKLSVGQKQRIAIARAVLRNPKILILDEPTSALDVQTEKAITTSLERLMADRTTIIIAHRLSTVRKADRILVFDKGKLAEQGNHDSLIKKRGGVYERLYRLHIGLQ